MELERMLSPVFIEGGSYGTRASTVLTLSAGHLRMRERTFGASGFEAEVVVER